MPSRDKKYIEYKGTEKEFSFFGRREFVHLQLLVTSKERFSVGEKGREKNISMPKSGLHPPTVETEKATLVKIFLLLGIKRTRITHSNALEG